MYHSRLAFHLKTALQLIEVPSFVWVLIQFLFLGLFFHLKANPIAISGMELDPVATSFTFYLTVFYFKNASRIYLHDHYAELLSRIFIPAIILMTVLVGLSLFLNNPYVTIQFMAFFAFGNGISHLFYKNPETLGDLNSSLIGIENRDDLFAFKNIHATFRFSTAAFIQYLVFFHHTESWVPLYVMWVFISAFFQFFLEQFYIGYVIYERDKNS